MNKQEAFKIVYDELKKNTLYMGKFDGKNGNKDFMYGISTVMEDIAFCAGMMENYNNTWAENFTKSLKED